MKKLNAFTAGISGVLTTGVLIAAADISIVVSLVAGVATAGAALFALPSSKEKKGIEKKSSPVRRLVQKEKREESSDLSHLKTLTTQIISTEMRKQLERIIILSEKMIEEEKNDSRDSSQLISFYNNYLPSTVTIVAKYIELSRKTNKSDAVHEALQKCEKSLTTIEQAFEKQLTNLLDNDILDLDVEVSVLEQSLQMDGLVERKRSTHEQ